MNEKVNTSLHSLSLLAIVGLTCWYFFAGDISQEKMLTFLILILAFIEVISLLLVAKLYPESHTQFKIGIIATFMVLLGIKSMLPALFAPLTITVIAINFFYNFYTSNKRQKGAFKRRSGKKLRL